jgi:hypothetical protein
MYQPMMPGMPMPSFPPRFNKGMKIENKKSN